MTNLKTGSEIDVRPRGSERWVRCRIEIASGNRKSLVVSAEEGLPLVGYGVGIDTRNGRLTLLLLDDGDGFRSVHGSVAWDVREVSDE